jgi:hypothetical protein
MKIIVCDYTVCFSYTETMTMVSRKRRSAFDTGQEPEAKIERSNSKSEKQKKPNKAADGTIRKDSKKIKTTSK